MPSTRRNSGKRAPVPQSASSRPHGGPARYQPSWSDRDHDSMCTGASLAAQRGFLLEEALLKRVAAAILSSATAIADPA